MNTAQAVDHRPRPVEIRLLPFQRPARGRAVGDIAEIADLVGQLDELGALADLPGMDDLQALALGLGQRLVVGNFENDRGDLRPEIAQEFLRGRVSVLDGVVQDGGDERGFVVHVRLVRQHVGQGDRMVDVGRRGDVLAPLVTVLVRGKGKGGLLGDGYGKGVGPGHGVGFVGLPSIMRSRCSPQERMEKMRQNGGNEDCEKAVVKALDWFKSKQNADGSWGNQWKGGMTGLVLLCYYGHCETPESPFYGENILKGINYLINLAQQKNGFFTEMKTNHCVYEHGIACYALGETYSFSKLGKKEMPGLRESFERGVAIIIEHQQDDGNWAYGGNSPHYVKYGREDMSVTGWQFQALKAAKHTNLKITGLPASMRKAEQWLEGKLQADGGIGQHTEKGKAYGSHTMTGIGVLGIQTLGGNRGVANKGLRFLTEQFDKDPLDWNKNANIYCWYYNTQAFFQKGGREWEAWNKQFRDQLLKNQNPDGSYAAEQGDFNGATSAAAGSDSDIYRATLCTLMLEVYYRYLKVGDRGSDAGFGLQ